MSDNDETDLHHLGWEDANQYSDEVRTYTCFAGHPDEQVVGYISRFLTNFPARLLREALKDIVHPELDDPA